MRKRFDQLVDQLIRVLGSPFALLTAAAMVGLWGLSGPVFGFSDTWQLVINTGTTIVTFLMVFVIQNSQNRDAKAVHIKLDELVRALDGARERVMRAEEESEEEQEREIRTIIRLARSGASPADAGEPAKAGAGGRGGTGSGARSPSKRSRSGSAASTKRGRARAS